MRNGLLIGLRGARQRCSAAAAAFSILISLPLALGGAILGLLVTNRPIIAPVAIAS